MPHEKMERLEMSGLLDLVVQAHGGIERWNAVRAIEVTFNFTGALLELKGFPGHRRPTAFIDAREPRTVLEHIGGDDRRWVFTPERVWIERPDGSLVEERGSPRAAFKGHERSTPWDHLHLTYFLGYAMWNYLTAPFLFTRPGFKTKELQPHSESGETWRVLEVTYPDDIPAHCSVQLLYFGEDGMLRRLDYVTDVLGGVAAHYCYDPKNFDGLTIPTFRRVVRRTPEGPKLAGPTSFSLDYSHLRVINQ
jgi:hypothetical protein